MSARTWYNPVSWFRREVVEADRRERAAQRAQKVMAEFQRKFEGAQTDRLNKNRWADAKGTPINVDLRADLTTLRDRCEFEVQNGGILAGMLESFVADVVGEEGPVLHINTSDDKYKAALSPLWDQVYRTLDVTGENSGTDLLGEACRGFFQAGEYLWDMVTDPLAAGPVKLRIQTYHTRRLQTPPGAVGRQDVTLGVHHTTQGRPLSYFVQESNEGEFIWTPGYVFVERDAKYIIHDFRRLVPSQRRGYPWVAPVLDDVADLRDYDRSTMAAAYAATLFAVLLYTENTEADPVALQGDYPIERQTMMAAPPGYRAEQLKPEQPGPMYAEFRGEKLTVIGRPVCMPRIKVTLNSANHSYSGMRFDGQGYNRVVQSVQGRLGRKALDRILEQVIVEGTRAGVLGRRPADLSTSWGWPALPEVDPGKEAAAITERLDNGTIDQQVACAKYGLDVDEVRARRKAQGMPEGPVLSSPVIPKKPSPISGDA